MAIQGNLTLGEIAKVEELSKQSMAAFGDIEKPQGLLMAALAFVMKRRQDPKFSWNDAQNLTFEEVSELLGLDEEEADQDAPLDQPTESTKTATSKPSKARKK